jgi:peroxiredoxin
MNNGWFARLAAAAAACFALVGTCGAEAVPGQAAPVLLLADVNGRAVNLADFRGKHVVLEWTNPNCPFVRKHYDGGNMQGLQKSLASADVVWLMVNSTTTSHSDYMTPQALAGWVRQHGAAPTALLMDADGKAGRSYGARTTPHMYVIDPQGRVVYAGAIDDKRSTNPADTKTANNYVTQAMSELHAGKRVSVPSTVAYGCSVKYKD